MQKFMRKVHVSMCEYSEGVGRKIHKVLDFRFPQFVNSFTNLFTHKDIPWIQFCELSVAVIDQLYQRICGASNIDNALHRRRVVKQHFEEIANRGLVIELKIRNPCLILCRKQSNARHESQETFSRNRSETFKMLFKNLNFSKVGTRIFRSYSTEFWAAVSGLRRFYKLMNHPELKQQTCQTLQRKQNLTRLRVCMLVSHASTHNLMEW